MCKYARKIISSSSLVSRFMRHPIEKNGGGIPGNDVADGAYPRQSVGGGD